MEFKKNDKCHEISFFGPNISRCLKTRNILFVMGPKYAQKRLGSVSAFLSHGKVKLVMEKSLNFIAQFLCELCFYSSGQLIRCQLEISGNKKTPKN